MGIIITLAILVLVLGFAVFNLVNKNEKQEEAIDNRNDFISKMSDSIEYSKNRLSEIDAKGSFASDDEIGWFFEEVKKIQEVMNQYIVDNQKNDKNDAAKEKEKK